MNNAGFAFGTLWQQATQAVGYVMKGLTEMSGIKAQTEIAKDNNYTTRYDTLLNSTFGNNGLFVMVTVVFIAILASKAYSKKN